jgi:putative phage-type endonuclease
MSDFSEWCDEHLPDVYDVGMFDSEEISDQVWETVASLADDTVLNHIDDSNERNTMSEELMDAARDWFRVNHEIMTEAILVAEPTELLRRPQTTQHSADWYSERRNRLTASEFSLILTGSRGRLLNQKIEVSAAPERPQQTPVAISQEEDGDMVATSWGHRFEPVVRKIYELELAGVNTVCDTLGRFQHKAIPWLSASPDGVVLRGALAGRLVEIKSPKTRQPDDFVPEDYYVQMQVQMEVCDVDAVDFIEAQFDQIRTDSLHEQKDIARRANWKGRIQVYGYLEDPATWTYHYSEPVEDLEDIVMSAPPTDLPLLEDSTWWLTGWFPRTVLRNREWWETIGWPAAQTFWAEVKSLREFNSTKTLSEPTQESDTVISHVKSGGWIGRS